MKLDFKRKSGRNKMMCSNSFERQEVNIIGQKKGELRDFSILWLEIIEGVFQLERKGI